MVDTPVDVFKLNYGVLIGVQKTMKTILAEDACRSKCLRIDGYALPISTREPICFGLFSRWVPVPPKQIDGEKLGTCVENQSEPRWEGSVEFIVHAARGEGARSNCAEFEFVPPPIVYACDCTRRVISVEKRKYILQQTTFVETCINAARAKHYYPDCIENVDVSKCAYDRYVREINRTKYGIV
jgi:hypothetical protein